MEGSASTTATPKCQTIAVSNEELVMLLSWTRTKVSKAESEIAKTRELVQVQNNVMDKQQMQLTMMQSQIEKLTESNKSLALELLTNHANGMKEYTNDFNNHMKEFSELTHKMAANFHVVSDCVVPLARRFPNITIGCTGNDVYIVCGERNVTKAEYEKFSHGEKLLYQMEYGITIQVGLVHPIRTENDNNLPFDERPKSKTSFLVKPDFDESIERPLTTDIDQMFGFVDDMLFKIDDMALRYIFNNPDLLKELEDEVKTYSPKK